MIGHLEERLSFESAEQPGAYHTSTEHPMGRHSPEPQEGDMPQIFPVIPPFIESDFHQPATEQHANQHREAETEDVVKLDTELFSCTPEPEMDGKESKNIGQAVVPENYSPTSTKTGSLL
jgi:hypothetical protein